MENKLKNNIIVKNDEVKFLDYFVIFLLIYLPSSFYGRSMKGSISLSILLVVAFAIVVINRKLKINVKSFMFILGIMILSIFTMIMNLESPYQYLIFGISIICAYCIYLSFSFTKFVFVFTRIMYFLCIFSLITFALLLSVPNVFSVFPTITNSAGLTVKNLLFSVIHNSDYFNSNFGMFWEPGAYQTFINLALYFQLFILKDLDTRRIIVFIVTIFTTFSTTGYICTFILFTIYLLINKNITKITLKKRKKLIIVALMLIVVGIFIFNMMPNHIVFKVFGKLEAIINPSLASQSIAYSSTTARIDAIKIPLINWIKSPFWGVGFENLYNYSINDNTNFLTATPLNWFGLFGLPLGFLFNYCFWRLTKFSRNGFFIRILEFGFLNLIILSEYYNMNSFLLTLIIYGFSAKYALYMSREVDVSGELRLG